MPLYLKDFAHIMGISADQAWADLPVNQVTYDSREVGDSCLFICKGAHFKPSYLDSAIQKGAIAYIAEKDYGVPIPFLPVKDLREVLAPMAALYYGYPDRHLDLFAITGTKGKTTAATYLHSILQQFGMEREEGPCGLLASTMTYDGKDVRVSHLTTPEPLELYATLAACRDHGCHRVVMEVSSQALKYRRTKGLRFNHAGFLNISEDHISPIEHKDFADYFGSKLKIFEGADQAYVNLGTDHLDEVMKRAESCPKVTTLSLGQGGDFQGRVAEDVDAGFIMEVEEGREKVRVHVPTLGHYNAENALMAIAMARRAGVSYETIKQGLASAHVQGRTERFETSDRTICLIVDYAHNKLSYEVLFREMDRLYPDYYKVAVFGSPGRKAINRRNDLGLLVGRTMDYAYVTLEDPYDEDPMTIAQEIAHSLDRVGGHYEINLDREGAIQAAFRSGRARYERERRKTLILILGKGDEDSQSIGQGSQPMVPDTEVARACVQDLDRKILNKEKAPEVRS
ncbi:Mur ligase family protein [Kallipyga gabonensis]|uniref:Mur ligase family protein n=1 Tax=Kallipyga gabonensis TaxID=1686287 RepID=UPI0006B55292|nr:Mur ligase family protein [Kallipyga gabonensis]